MALAGAGVTLPPAEAATAISNPDAALLAPCATFHAAKADRLAASADDDTLALWDDARDREWAAFDLIAAWPPAVT